MQKVAITPSLRLEMTHLYIKTHSDKSRATINHSTVMKASDFFRDVDTDKVPTQNLFCI